MKQPLLSDKKRIKNYHAIEEIENYETIEQGIKPTTYPKTYRHEKSHCVDPTTLYSIMAYACATASAALYAINNDSEQNEITNAAIVLMVMSAMFRLIIVDLNQKADSEWLKSREYRDLVKRMHSSNLYKISTETPLSYLVLIPLNHLMMMTNKTPLTVYMTSRLATFQHRYYIVCTLITLWLHYFPQYSTTLDTLLTQHWWNGIDGLSGPYQMISNVFEARYKKSGSCAKSFVALYNALINSIMLIKSSLAIYNSSSYETSDYWLFSLSMLGGLMDSLLPTTKKYINRVWEKKINILNQESIQSELASLFYLIESTRLILITKFIKDKLIKKQDALTSFNAQTEYIIVDNIRNFPLLYNNDQDLYSKIKKHYLRKNKKTDSMLMKIEFKNMELRQELKNNLIKNKTEKKDRRLEPYQIKHAHSILNTQTKEVIDKQLKKLEIIDKNQLLINLLYKTHETENKKWIKKIESSLEKDTLKKDQHNKKNSNNKDIMERQLYDQLPEKRNTSCRIQ